jgi:predicted ester cyclase
MADDLRERRRLFDEEIVNRHDLEAIPKWFAPDFVDHVEVPGMPPGVEGVRARHQMLFTAMPDIRIVVEDVVAEGDTTAARFMITGTDTGGFMGMPATNQQVRVKGWTSCGSATARSSSTGVRWTCSGCCNSSVSSRADRRELRDALSMSARRPSPPPRPRGRSVGRLPRPSPHRRRAAEL